MRVRFPGMSSRNTTSSRTAAHSQFRKFPAIQIPLAGRRKSTQSGRLRRLTCMSAIGSPSSHSRSQCDGDCEWSGGGAAQRDDISSKERCSDGCRRTNKGAQQTAAWPLRSVRRKAMDARAEWRDYSLTGPEASNSVDGWYATPIPRKRLKELMRRRDMPALMNVNGGEKWDHRGGVKRDQARYWSCPRSPREGPARAAACPSHG